MRVNIDIGAIAGLKERVLEVVGPRSDVYRKVSLELIPMVHERIHVDGKAANGSKIGTYSNNYLKLRQKKYKRNSSPDVILSATRQMENDYAVVAGETGWGIGFNNPFNADKAKWNDQRYGPTVYDLSKEELEYAQERSQELIQEALK